MEHLEVLNKIIVGRVEPHIYAFSTETVPNYLKVGDTYRPIEVRLNEWRKHFPNLEKQYSEIAKASDEIYFRDYAIHLFLQSERHRSRLTRSDIPNIPYFSNEFFGDATTQDVEDAINDIKENLQSDDKKYQFYRFDESLLPVVTEYERTETFSPRKNQQDAIDNFNKARANGRTNLLMYAVMRFGKTFTSMCCATEMGAKLVVIVSGKADVREEWKKCIESHHRFEDYKFLSSDDLQRDNAIVGKTLEDKSAALFLTLQDLQGENIKDKHQDIFGREIDLLIIDETHFAARADQLGQVLNAYDPKEYKQQQKEVKDEVQLIAETDKTIKSFSTKVRLHLSGTPYRILMGSEFKPEDVIAFCQFTDILRDQELWDDEHLNEDETKEWDNPYYGFPQMVRFAFNPNQSSIDKMEEMRRNKVTYAFSELLRPQSTDKQADNSHRKFKNEREVLDLFEVIDGSKEDENLLGFLNYDKIKAGKMCRHIVCVLPFRAACDALEELINNNRDKFQNLCDYEIINIAGLDSPNAYNSVSAIKAKIKECEKNGKKTITLTVNRMLTGTTVEEWDTMIYLKDTASPQEYDQAIFRLQSQYIRKYKDDNGDTIKYNMKPQTLLVDFSPNRMFYMQEQKSQFYNVNTDKSGNDNLRERIEEELRVSPIITINSGKISQVTPADLMSEIRKYTSDKSVLDEATDIPIDLELMTIPELKDEIDNQPEIGSKEGLKTKAVQGDGEDMETPDVERGDSSPTPAAESTAKENSDDEDVLRKKFATYYSRILFYAFLSNSDVKSLSDIVTSIDTEEDNIRIAKNLGLKKDIVELFSLMNPFVLSKLDYKIENLNALSNDTSLAPLHRVENAMNKFGRISESEITTPKHIASDMVDMLPAKSINEGAKVLDIASKQGEFATALINKFGEVVKMNIYSIATSPVAYEFTRKVYETLGMPVENIVSDFTSYDIIKEENTEIIERLENMKFDVIVGNPPYHEADGGAGASARPIYQKFVSKAKNLEPTYLSMIMPSRWYAGGKGLDEFRRSMINDVSIKIFHDFLHPEEVFPNTNNRGGVCYFLMDSNYDNQKHKTTVVTHLGGEDIKIINREFKVNDVDIFLRRGESVSILNKVVQIKDYKSISSNISPRKPFGIDKRVILSGKLKMAKSKIASITCYIKGMKKLYIKRDDVLAHSEWVDNYKVYIPRANNIGTELNDDNLNTFMGCPGDICSESYIAVGADMSLDENSASNLMKYFTTRFARFQHSLSKASQDATSKTFEFVPQQDFTQTSDIDWNKPIKEIDSQLYKKYNLTPDEITFIESTIKPME